MQPVTGRVGAPLPAKPCASVARRQHFALERSQSPAELAPHYRQSLVPPLRGANILPWSAAGHRPSWRLGAGKTLCLRYGAPTFYPEDRPVTAHVGARLPAKPYASVTRRQHFALERSRSPPKLAPHYRQSLVPPLRGANILPWSAVRSPAELAPHCRQNLVPPLRGANILPWSAARSPAELAPHCRQNLMPPLRGANILP